MLRFRRLLAPAVVMALSSAAIASLDEDAPLTDRTTEAEPSTVELAVGPGGAVAPRVFDLHVESADAASVTLSVDLTATWEGAAPPVSSGAFPVLQASLDEMGSTTGAIVRHRAVSMSLAHDRLELELDSQCDPEVTPCVKEYHLTLERIETAPAGRVVVTVAPIVVASTYGTEPPSVVVTEVE